MHIPNLSRITSVLFDFDGVIADTENGRYEAYADIFLEYGYDLRSRCSVTDLVGFTGDGFMSKYFPEIPKETVKEIVDRRQSYYMEHLDRFCKPYPGMLQTVTDLKDKGYYLALTTANATKVAGQLLDVVGALPYFDMVCGREICENPVTKVKDYSLVPQYIHKEIDDCIVIEDSPVGVSGAKRAGFFCIAFEHFEDPVITEYADVMVHNYNELRELFGLSSISG